MILASMMVPDIGLQLSDSAKLDERRRQEPAQADIDDEATLDDLDDRSLDDLVCFLDLLDVGPRTLVLRTLLRQDQATFLVLLLEDKRLDRLTESNDLLWVHVVADGQLPDRDHTLRLVADVDEHLVTIDLDDGSLDQVTVLELDDRGDHRALELGCTQVVLDDGAGDVVAFVVEGSHLLWREGGDGVSHESLPG